MAQKCVHKGCGKSFTDPDEECRYHPGPPEFHEGQKGWKCCKPRVLTFDEFLSIPPCTAGTHSAVDDTPAPASTPTSDAADPAPPAPAARLPQPEPAPRRPSPAPAPPDDESDDPSLAILPGQACRRRGCAATHAPDAGRDEERCVHHPGAPVFHEGSKGYTCCKRRVLEFDEFLKIEGCRTKRRHLFVGSGRTAAAAAAAAAVAGEESLASVRHDFYQTAAAVTASLFLKKIDAARSSVAFSATAVALDLRTADNKRYAAELPLRGAILPHASTYTVMATKLELTLAKADGSSWRALRADEPETGDIIQTGRAGRA